jgi:protein TonB
MSLVAAIHAAVLLAIMRSLGIGAPMEPPPPIDGEFIEDRRPPDEPPPMPNPDLRSPYESQVLPPLEMQQLVFDQEIITLPPDIEIEGPTVPEQPRVELVGVRIDPRHPLSQPPYPPAIIREGFQGTVDLEVYVLPSGRVGDVRVIKSTGREALDNSAIAEAKRFWKLLPATRDGEPIAQWHRLRVTFKLKDGSN